MTSHQATQRTFRGADGGPERIPAMRTALRSLRAAFRPARRIIRVARMILRAGQAAAG